MPKAKKPTPQDKFSKIKEEIRRGKSGKAAIKEALERAKKGKKP